MYSLSLSRFRAEKSDVLTEDMVVAEKRVELIRQACQNTTKKVALCLQGIGLDHATLEKRQVRSSFIPYYLVYLAFYFKPDSLMHFVCSFSFWKLETVADDQRFQAVWL